MAETSKKGSSTAKAAVSMYAVEDLAGVARSLFGCSPDIVTAALRSAGAQMYTKDDALAIVDKFRRKKVQ